MTAKAAIILAAGKSTRMKSNTAKVLHEVCGIPMLAHVLDACHQADVERLIVVVGHDKDAVKETFADRPNITWVEQKEQLGTGHAALVCESALADFDGQTIVMAGDMPLVRNTTLTSLMAQRESTGHGVTLASSIFDEPGSYGRIARDSDGSLSGIVEAVDCTPQQLGIREVNISYYCFDNRRLFEVLHEIRPDNAKGEYYITDAVRLMLEKGYGASAMASVKPEDAMGVNSRADLSFINSVMQRRIQEEWMDRGVSIVDRGNTWIESGCSIGVETVIFPFSYVCRGAQIGSECRIGPFAMVGEDEEVVAGATVGPMPIAGASLS